MSHANASEHVTVELASTESVCGGVRQRQRQRTQHLDEERMNQVGNLRGCFQSKRISRGWPSGPAAAAERMNQVGNLRDLNFAPPSALLAGGVGGGAFFGYG